MNMKRGRQKRNLLRREAGRLRADTGSPHDKFPSSVDTRAPVDCHCLACHCGAARLDFARCCVGSGHAIIFFPPDLAGSVKWVDNCDFENAHIISHTKLYTPPSHLQSFTCTCYMYMHMYFFFARFFLWYPGLDTELPTAGTPNVAKTEDA